MAGPGFVPVDMVRHIREFYESWAGLVRLEGLSVPDWEELDAVQTAMWGLAYATTLEVGIRMGKAASMTIGGSNGD